MGQQMRIDMHLEQWLSTLETELTETPTYQDTLEQLEQLIGGKSEQAAQLLQAFTQQVLQFAAQRLPQAEADPSVSPQTTEPKPQSAGVPENSSPFDFLFGQSQGQNTPRVKVKQQRTERIEAIGQILQQTRESQGISRQQLHYRTLIPVHQIQALEEGKIEQLPEDIFVRGFISRLGQSLGLEGKALADSVPSTESAVLSSWSGSTGAIAPRPRNSLPLYLGYAALVASAVGGLSWSLDQAQPSPTVNYDSSVIQETSPKVKEEQVASDLRPSGQIAPPERMEN
jgi:cytoskeleton protein RodZ